MVDLRGLEILYRITNLNLSLQLLFYHNYWTNCPCNLDDHSSDNIDIRADVAAADVNVHDEALNHNKHDAKAAHGKFG